MKPILWNYNNILLSKSIEYSSIGYFSTCVLNSSSILWNLFWRLPIVSSNSWILCTLSLIWLLNSLILAMLFLLTSTLIFATFLQCKRQLFTRQYLLNGFCYSIKFITTCFMLRFKHTTFWPSRICTLSPNSWWWNLICSNWVEFKDMELATLFSSAVSLFSMS